MLVRDKMKKEKEYTYQEAMKLFPIIVECSVSTICEKFNTHECKTCLQNRFHIVLKDKFEHKKHFLKG